MSAFLSWHERKSEGLKDGEFFVFPLRVWEKEKPLLCPPTSHGLREMAFEVEGANTMLHSGI